jgi:putative ABC transport system permease protein
MTTQSDAAEQEQRGPGRTPALGTIAPGRRARGARWSLGSLPGLLVVVGQRLWNHLALMLAIAAGFMVAVAIVVCIPVYAEAVGYRVLRDELSKGESGTRRPPFAFMYRYLGAQNGATTWDAYTKLDTYMRDSVAGQLGLPVQQQVRYVATDKLPVVPANGAGEPIFYTNLAFATDFDKHIDIVDGKLPQTTADGPIEVLIAENQASKLGFQVGETYMVLGPKENRAGQSVLVRIAGVWRAKNFNDPYWFYQPNGFDETMFITESSYTGRVLARNPKSVYVALWYLVADGRSIRSNDVPAVSSRIARTNTQASALMPGARLELSPSPALGRHQAQVRRITLLLTIFSLPVLGLVAYFIFLVAGLIVQRQSNEIAVLRSRGASRSQILGVYLLEELLIGLLALGLGLLLGQAAALLMTWTRSFLDLVPIEPLPIELTPDAWSRAGQMLLLMLAASLFPALRAAGYTVVSYKNERARSISRPFWQRAYLDILLLMPAYYGYSQLRQRGALGALRTSSNVSDPFGDPLLLLAPGLYMFALALVATRLFPLAMRALAWLLRWVPGIAAITALRYLARTPRAYTGPVLLLTLTLGLATFTSSMARTLDEQLVDQTRYETGGDMRLDDFGQSTAPAVGPGAGAPAQQPGDKIDEAQYLFLPVSDYLSVPGVTNATRVGRTDADLEIGGQPSPVQLIGVDRADFAQVATWRDDYAPEPLGALMNHLADDSGAVLVSSSYAAQRQLHIGDQLTLTVRTLSTPRQMPVVVAGYINLLPTVYPEEGAIVVANLDYIFENVGTQFPYEVWLKLQDGVAHETVADGVQELGVTTFERGYAPDAIVAAQARPERQGVFGLLSVGFVAAAFLTALGFLFYAALSFQRRFVELGMLRAIGLSARQLGALLGIEQVLIVGVGMLAGTIVGVSASTLFIPFLQVRGGQHPATPPFLVSIAWDQIQVIYMIFGALLVFAVVITLALLRRMQLFQAIKLGEAI